MTGHVTGAPPARPGHRRGQDAVRLAIPLVAVMVILLDAAGLMAGRGVLWTGLFALAGAALLLRFRRHPTMWWAAAASGALLGLAVAEAWEHLALPPLPEAAAALVLVLTGAGFWAAFAGTHHRWPLVAAGAGLAGAVVLGLTGHPDAVTARDVLLAVAAGLGLITGLGTAAATPLHRRRASRRGTPRRPPGAAPTR
ncbi:hypothetical protein [Georgenia thermotolerans]|uniref:Uncharacterized protein n=1 Tax=Georgenia thermotolerans TaxID=527326 RepID=A0A7J5UPR6_9MICO|nr:hypothetical protein [Georgenia thermotolerans]KAE8764104.1 hypothetical protein GB883_10645 [Georgenia thermotolerans]